MNSSCQPNQEPALFLPRREKQKSRNENFCIFHFKRHIAIKRDNWIPLHLHRCPLPPPPTSTKSRHASTVAQGQMTPNLGNRSTELHQSSALVCQNLKRQPALFIATWRLESALYPILTPSSPLLHGWYIFFLLELSRLTRISTAGTAAARFTRHSHRLTRVHSVSLLLFGARSSLQEMVFRSHFKRRLRSLAYKQEDGCKPVWHQGFSEHIPKCQRGH